MFVCVCVCVCVCVEKCKNGRKISLRNNYNIIIFFYSDWKSSLCYEQHLLTLIKTFN